MASIDPATLEVPADLKPRDGRFGCGPTKIRPEAVTSVAERAGDLLGTSHRQPPVKSLVGRLQEGIADLFSVPDGYEVVLGNGGATAFWDAAVFGLIRERSLHYVFGEFSSKFSAAAAAAPWLKEIVRVETDPGGRPDLAVQDEVDVQALTHNETSTGVAMDVRRPQDDALVLVDATSGAGGLPVDMGEADAYYFSLQKGFASEGGLWVAVLSPAAIDRTEELSVGRYVPASLDLSIAIDNARKQQTYNTPAVVTLLLALDQVDWLLDRGGLAAAVDDCAAKADHVYGWAEARDWAEPFVRDPAARSNVVATIDLEGVSAADVGVALRANGIVDTESYRKLGRNQLRVGLFPAVDRADVEAFTASVDWIIERLG
ncbi:MAG: phosphoserine transaminase [Nitriliruptorales bacterium]